MFVHELRVRCNSFKKVCLPVFVQLCAVRVHRSHAPMLALDRRGTLKTGFKKFKYTMHTEDKFN